MDRRWVRGRLFSPEHIDGVKHFMSFIQEKFSENAEVLCPCGRCLNQRYLCQPLVEKHILMNGMDSTYTRWIHHGESIHAEVVDQPLNRDDDQGPVFEAAEIARLMKQSNRELPDSDGEEDEDDTLSEYCSEGEEGASTEVDSDDE